MKKVIAIILLAITVILAVSCNDDPDPQPPEDAVLLTPITASASSYKIVIPRSASIDEKNAANLLKEKIIELVGIELEIIDDYVNEKRGIVAGEYEILVGITSRDETKQVYRELRANDYKISVIGKKLVVLGGNQLLTLNAMQSLVSLISADEMGNIDIKQSHCVFVEGEYAISECLVNGTDAREYSIVYADKDTFAADMANLLNARIFEPAQMRISIKSDSNESAGKEIVIGRTNRESEAIKNKADTLGEGEAFVASDGDKIYVIGKDEAALRYAVYSLLLNYDEETVANAVNINFELKDTDIKDSSPIITTMTFNICYTKYDPEQPDYVDERLDPEVWAMLYAPDRGEKIIKTVRDRMPTTVGFQEVTEDWLEVLIAGLGDKYDWVGELNDTDQQRWRNVIFYQRDILELVRTETKWISPTPNEQSRFDTAWQYRIYTLAEFRHKETGTEFTHVNLHLEFLEDVRVPQAKVMEHVLSKIEGPYFVTGDHNFTRAMPSYEIFTSKLMWDSLYQAIDKHEDPIGGSIDYCFVSKNDFNVREYYVENEAICSDHMAVYFELSFLPQK